MARCGLGTVDLDAIPATSQRTSTLNERRLPAASGSGRLTLKAAKPVIDPLIPAAPEIPADAEAGELVDLEELIGFELRRTNAASARKFVEILSDLKLKPGQFSILFTAFRSPDQTQASLARILSLDPSSVVPLVDQLERKGYLARLVKNRRSHAIRVTDLGKTVVERAEQRIKDHEQLLVRGLKKVEQRTMLDLLRRMRRNLDGSQG
jgi:DNA-binding MarR family transcriptional regulator